MNIGVTSVCCFRGLLKLRCLPKMGEQEMFCEFPNVKNKLLFAESCRCE